MRKGRTRLPLVRAEPGAPSVKVKIVRILTSESIATRALSLGKEELDKKKESVKKAIIEDVKLLEWQGERK